MNEASFTNFQVTGKYLSIETLAILHKIREVGELLSRDRSARSVIRETHPEICFWALSRGLGLKHPKKKKDGFIERKDLLQSVFPMTVDIVEHALKSYLRKNVGKDDILDALANVATARLGFGKFKTFPEVPPKDSTGLPMEMVYFKSSSRGLEKAKDV
jgi:predicted RNase H-like nuclease